MSALRCVATAEFRESDGRPSTATATRLRWAVVFPPSSFSSSSSFSSDVTPRLSAEGIVVQRDRGRALVLDGATLVLAAGAVALIRGSSGAGKTTFLRVLAGLTKADRGRVLLDGADVESFEPAEQRRKLGFVAQQAAMLPGSVADNVRAGPTLAGQERTPAEIDKLLSQVGLPLDFAAREARQLSGGERQRVALARALALRPSVLLLDEPTAALDRSSADHIVKLIHDLVSGGLSIVLVTHDESIAPQLAPALEVAVYDCIDGRLVPAPPAS
jgi:putative ABC transport system ATP-binding protein